MSNITEILKNAPIRKITNGEARKILLDAWNDDAIRLNTRFSSDEDIANIYQSFCMALKALDELRDYGFDEDLNWKILV